VNQPAYNWFGIVFTDDSGNRYVLGSDKTWNYLFLAPGSSSSGNPAVYKDSNSANYMIYPDSTTGNKYVKNADGTKTFLTGFPTTTYGNPISFTDAFSNVYTVYSDPEGNKYVTYSDPKGKYYLTSSGSKVYLPTTVTNSGTTSNTTTVANNTTTTGPLPTTTGITYVFTDSTGGNRYTLSSNGTRVYLTLNSTSGATQTYTDPQSNKYIITKDPATGNSYLSINGGLREYLTSFPTSTLGSPVALTDSLGTKYAIYSDSLGNKYVAYTDSLGVYYINSNGVKVYLPDSQQTSGVTGASMTYVFTDSTSGSRYVLAANGNRVYLTLASTSGATQTLTDPQGNKYTITKDPSTGNSYTTLTGNVREYLTSSPQTVTGSPIALTDSLGTQYTIYSDPQGYKYVQYHDPSGAYYINSTGYKVYVPTTSSSTGSFTQQQLIFTDSTGGNMYLLSSNGTRIYLTAVSTSGATQTLADPQGARYTVTKDPATNNVYTVLGSGVR